MSNIKKLLEGVEEYDEMDIINQERDLWTVLVG